jgi:protocatechuate 3,4-dioxygenase beta subunit
MPDNKITRRTALQVGLGAAAGAVAGKAFASTPLSEEECATPAQTEGPFYPKKDQLDKDADMTRVEGRAEAALGEVVVLKGVVIDESLAPVAGAIVDAWQANTHGRYHHEDDPNPAPEDPNFQGWAKLKTAVDGSFTIRTIVPGAYPVDESWWRPPHIHFKVAKRGYHELTTQMYFAGNELNSKDRILQELTPAEQERLVVDFEDSREDAVRVGHLVLMIKAVPRD